MTKESSMSDIDRPENERYLSFTLGGEELAIPLLSVKEVLAMPDVTPVPQSPPHFLGIMNLRGQILSIIDLRKKLNIEPGESREVSVIICDFGDNHVGYVVDTVNSVFATTESDLSPAPEVQGSTKGAQLISWVYKKEKNLVLILDPQRLFNATDRSVASTAIRAAA